METAGGAVKGGMGAVPTRQTYGRGFAGLIAGETDICRIDGAAGRLWIRGYPIEDLCEFATFEEMTYLVLHGDLPNQRQLNDWSEELKSWRKPPDKALRVADQIPPTAHPLMMYRTMLSVAACDMPEGENTRLDAQWRRPARILSWTAGLAAATIRRSMGKGYLQPRAELTFVENLLYQSFGYVPAPEFCRGFEVSLIAQCEHGLHAAALAALVVVSTAADLGSAVLAGMGALSGVRHGGANQHAFEMIAALPDPASAQQWARERLATGHRFPGFGHRIYKAPDPRVRALEPWAKLMLEKSCNGELWDVYSALRTEIEAALGPKGIYANVDLITGLIYHPLGLKPAMMSLPFALSVQTGWMAHCMEYLPDGKMIEPGAVYISEGNIENDEG